MSPRPDIHSWEKALLLTTLPSTTKLVLLVIKHSTNTFGEITWPSQDLLASRCSLSKRAIISHLQAAEKAGWIKRVKLADVTEIIAEQTGRKVVKRKSAGKDWAALAYQCCWPDEQSMVNMQRVKDVHPMGRERGEGRSPPGMKDVHPTSIVNKHPNLNTPIKTPPTPKAVDNGDKSGVVKHDNLGNGRSYRVAHHLTDTGWQAARKAADGWDIHRLAAIYDAGVAKRGMPRYPDKAFVAWCKAYTKGNKP